MRHLELLAEAGLVTSRKRGRERWHYLNAVPLQRLHERWHDPLASGWASRLLRLQRNVEQNEGRRVKPTDLAIDLALDVTIDGTPAEVFSALTRDPGGWWGHPFLRPDATDVTLEPRLGGLLLERWSEGGAVIAAVTGWQEDRHLTLSRPVSPRDSRSRDVRPHAHRLRDAVDVLVPRRRRGRSGDRRGDAQRVERASVHATQGAGGVRQTARYRRRPAPDADSSIHYKEQ